MRSCSFLRLSVPSATTLPFISACLSRDELPKASSKERGGGGKVNFFFENLSLVPETREVMEHFKLVFGSGTSDLAKIRPLKNWPPPFPGSHRLLGTSIAPRLCLFRVGVVV